MNKEVAVDSVTGSVTELEERGEKLGHNVAYRILQELTSSLRKEMMLDELHARRAGKSTLQDLAPKLEDKVTLFKSFLASFISQLEIEVIDSELVDYECDIANHFRLEILGDDQFEDSEDCDIPDEV